MRNLVLAVLGMGAPQSATQRAGLVRDSFGLHKMLVVATESGKVYTCFLYLQTEKTIPTIILL